MTAYRARLLAGIVGVTLLLAAVWVFSLYRPLTDAVIELQTEHLEDVAASLALIVDATGVRYRRPSQTSEPIQASGSR